jgi:hypothetical protein
MMRGSTRSLIVALVFAWVSFTPVAASAIPAQCIAQLGPQYAQHGNYSELYWTDWSTLGNGRDCAPTFAKPGDPEYVAYQTVSLNDEDELDLTPYTDVNGDVWIFGEIQNHRYELAWQETTAVDPNVERTFIHFDGAGIHDLYIDRLALKVAGARYGRHSLLVENCNRVTLTNLYLEGPVDQAHVLIRNCKEVYIDRVEVAGREDLANPGQYLLGGGIVLDNGSKGASPDWTDAWATIQNVYVHDFNVVDATGYLATNPNPNFDAIAIRSPGDGILFNVFVENWTGLIEASGTAFIDAGLDLGHDRVSAGYEGKTFRVERTIFDGVDFNKLAGRYNVPSAQNRVVFVNNVYQDTSWLNYACSFEAFFHFETYLYSDGAAGTNVHYKHGGCWAPTEHPTASVGPTHFNSALVAMMATGGVRSLNAVLNLNLNNSGIHTYAPATSTSEIGLIFDFDDNVYLADFPIFEGPSKAWMVSNEAAFASLLTFQDWASPPASQDGGSYVDETFTLPTACLVGTGLLDVHLTSSCPAVGAGNWAAVHDGPDQSIRAIRDFYGKSRYDVFPFPSAGAAETAPSIVAAVDASSFWSRVALVLLLTAGGTVIVRSRPVDA